MAVRFYLVTQEITVDSGPSAPSTLLPGDELHLPEDVAAKINQRQPGALRERFAASYADEDES